jgi:hypothetical protein
MNVEIGKRYKRARERTARVAMTNLFPTPDIESNSYVARHATMKRKKRNKSPGRNKKKRRTTGAMHTPEIIRFVSSCTRFPTGFRTCVPFL